MVFISAILTLWLGLFGTLAIGCLLVGLVYVVFLLTLDKGSPDETEQ